MIDNIFSRLRKQYYLTNHAYIATDGTKPTDVNNDGIDDVTRLILEQMYSLVNFVDPSLVTRTNIFYTDNLLATYELASSSPAEMAFVVIDQEGTEHY